MILKHWKNFASQGDYYTTGCLLNYSYYLIKSLAKSVLIPLALTRTAIAADAGIHKKILDSGTTTLTISNDEMENIMKIVKSLEGSSLLLKGVSETLENEAKD